jgi:hypothetical protein
MHPRTVFICILILLFGSRGGAQDVPQFGYDPRTDFVAFNPQYRQQKRATGQQYERLKAELVKQQKARRDTFCSRQVLQEAKYWTYCTAHLDQAQAKLDQLDAMLSQAADPYPRRQEESDGSFAGYTDQWFMKLDYTIDELITLGMKWQEPKFPVKLLERINSPQKLTDYFDSMLISDVRKTGIDTRTELNASSSDLCRFILWQGTWDEIPTKFDLDPGLKETLIDYLDNKWQDPRTGFWGTWYRGPDGSIIKTADLSMTFHIVNFRRGDVKHWPEIIRTTLAMKDAEYPYGWLEEGKMSNHHNYDVVTLLHLGWTFADEDQKQIARREIRRLLDWCVNESIEPDGTFKLNDENTLGGAFYFGVAFLNEIGYFNKLNRFWTDEDFPQAESLRIKLRDRLKSYELDDPEATWALMMLNAGG